MLDVKNVTTMEDWSSSDTASKYHQSNTEELTGSIFGPSSPSTAERNWTTLALGDARPGILAVDAAAVVKPMKKPSKTKSVHILGKIKVGDGKEAGRRDSLGLRRATYIASRVVQ